MLPVGHVPIIERLVANLVRGGVTDVTLALGFKARAVHRRVPRRPAAVVSRLALRGRARAARHGRRDPLRRRARPASTTRSSSPTATCSPISTSPRSSRSIAAPARGDDPSDSGRRPVVVRCGRDRRATARVERFVEKPPPGTAPRNLINAGTLRARAIGARAHPARAAVVDRARDVPAIVADGGLFAMATDDYWIDAGRPELYLQANLDLLDGASTRTRAIAIAPGADGRIRRPRSTCRSIVGGGASSPTVRRSRSRWCCPAPLSASGATVERSIVMGASEPGPRCVTR